MPFRPVACWCSPARTCGSGSRHTSWNGPSTSFQSVASGSASTRRTDAAGNLDGFDCAAEVGSPCHRGAAAHDETETPVPSHTGTGESDPPKWCVGRRVAAIGGRLAKVPRQAFPGGKWPAAAAQASGFAPIPDTR